MTRETKGHARERSPERPRTGTGDGHRHQSRQKTVSGKREGTCSLKPCTWTFLNIKEKSLRIYKYIRNAYLDDNSQDKSHLRGGTES